MSSENMNIRNKRLDELASAPTPQNTPAGAAAPIAGARAPSIPRIEEEVKGTEERDVASVLAGNPQLVSMIQGKLGNLVGKSSGYVESLPSDVQRRINGLKGVQAEHAKLEAQFQEEILLLEKKYLEKYQPLYDRRADIVDGEIEPTAEEVNVGEQDQEEDDDEESDGADSSVQTSGPTTENVKGVPEFWLTAMKNLNSLCNTINPRDEAALRYLKDIRISYLSKPGFKLTFVFAGNDFFTNKSLTKTYYYQEEAGYGGDFVYDHAEGDSVQWKDGQDLTVRYETKKQRNKNTKQTRIVKKTVPVDSFFNFFKPPTISDEEDDDAASDVDERLELDYQIGEDIKEKLIPRAVDWFTGAALAYEELDDDLAGDEFEEYDEDDADEDEESDEEGGNKPKQDPQECRQQ